MNGALAQFQSAGEFGNAKRLVGSADDVEKFESFENRRNSRALEHHWMSCSRARQSSLSVR